jgi:ABC-type transport system involved in multi-copper enzyme maturation permease subunit
MPSGVAGTGIDPIRYRPWSGKRTAKRERVLVISNTLFRKKMKSKWVILLMVLGYLGVWAVPIIFESLMAHESLDGETMAGQMGGESLFIFTVLLASLVCSDTISEDLRSNSFVLYFSRALRKEDYLAGKVGGIFMALSLFCLVPAVIMGIALLGTQSGSDYLSGFGGLGLTVIAGLAVTLFLVPLSLMISAFTTRKSFAAIGTFMTFFVLSIVGSIFADFDANWKLIDQGSLLAYFNDWLYGVGIPNDISGGLLAAMLCAFTLVPMALVYLRIHNKAVGK